MFHRSFQFVPPPFSLSTNDMPSTKTQHKGHPYLLPLLIIALYIQTSTKPHRLYFLNISGVLPLLPISKAMLSPPTFLTWIPAAISSLAFLPPVMSLQPTVANRLTPRSKWFGAPAPKLNVALNHNPTIS